ncbi:response regulator transcription factor [Clostridium sp. 19966]|uniref:response regulator transcription factor n=1 Tax=Clostridium sp. 19966 TaxID=2768166 RepID=UPI0028DDD248|nr:response regulator transcription factor [Clostridium sp. 19966]MDT8717791.1 response regulator transcription factor [Clostridium sp. 19966]
MNSKLIYIADDEINICNIIKSFLEKEGFEVRIFNDGLSLFQAFNEKEADALVLDIVMPEIDGFELCSLIRSKSSVPIIIVSAKDTEMDKITGLGLGGDDYLTKPFSPLELIARINSIFRRIELDSSSIQSSNILKISDITINIDTKEAVVNDVSLNLSSMELSLLIYLSKNKNRAVSREELLGKIWGFENKVETRATDDMIKRMRKKLSSSGSKVEIHTIWGFGFRLYEREGFDEK